MKGSRTMARRLPTLTLRTLTLRMRDVQHAYTAAETVSAAWRAADPRWGSDTWQVAGIEALMLPGVWDHLKARAAITGNGWAPRSFDYYGPITRGTIADEKRPQCAGLPGYAMQHWTDTGPASTVWDGIRRELYGSDAAYHLQALAFCTLDRPGWQSPDQRAHAASESRRVLADTYGINVK